MKKLLTLLLIGSFSLQLHAQNDCGTPAVPQHIYDYLESIDYSREMSEDIIRVPVTIHIVRTSSGSGSFSPGRALEGICNVNERFQSSNMRFYIAGDIQFIDSDTYLNVTSYSVTSGMISSNNVANTVNIYYTNLSAMGLCGFAYYPNSGPGGPNNQGAVVMSFACSQPTGTTLAHELGHFFALPHTFDRTANNPQHPTNAELVTRNFNEPSPRISANCNTAGDRFCDTPSDFIDYRWACPTGAAALDLNSDVIRPDSSYYMSYANDICTNRFSEQQITAMRNTLIGGNPSRGYLLANSPPVLDAITTAPTLLSPANGDSNITGNFAFFQWTSVPGAQFYHFKVYQFGGILMDTLIQDTSYLNLNTRLRPNRQLEWEVKAYNATSLCGPASSRNNFRTGNYAPLSVENTPFAELNVFPNPLTVGEMLQISGLANQMAQIRISDIQGRLLMNNSYQVENGLLQLDIDLSAGLYILQIQQADAVVFRKVKIDQ